MKICPRTGSYIPESNAESENLDYFGTLGRMKIREGARGAFFSSAPHPGHFAHIAKVRIEVAIDISKIDHLSSEIY